MCRIALILLSLFAISPAAFGELNKAELSVSCGYPDLDKPSHSIGATRKSQESRMDWQIKHALVAINSRRNVAGSLAILEKASLAGNMLARFELGSLYMLDLHGIEYDVTLRPLRADWGIARSYLLGVTGEKQLHAMILLGAIHAQAAQATPQDIDLARKYFSQSKRCIDSIAKILAHKGARSEDEVARGIELHFESGLLTELSEKYKLEP